MLACEAMLRGWQWTVRLVARDVHCNARLIIVCGRNGATGVGLDADEPASQRAVGMI